MCDSLRLRILMTVVFLCIVLAACNQQLPPPTPAATPLPAIDLRPVGGTIKAAGKIAPHQMANLSFPNAGRVVRIATAVGEQVSEGDLLMALEDASAQTAVTQAQAALVQAEAHLAELQAAPLPAAVAATQANLDAAQAHLDQLKEGARPAAITAAKAELAAAEAALQQLSAGPTEPERINARTALRNAEVAQQQAQTLYDQVAWRQDADAQSAGWQLQLATNNAEAAKALYAALEAKPTADRVAAATARVQQAEATLQQLQSPPSAGQLAEADALVRSAQAALDLLQTAPRPEALLVATATISETQAALSQAEVALSNCQLLAPFTGTVSAINLHVGELASPGTPVITLGDLSQWQVETTDLSERDVARVALGQTVSVFVEALGVDVPGQVIRIAPQASVIGGDVVYPVTISLTEPPPTLRWGMTVQVEIQMVAQ